MSNQTNAQQPVPERQVGTTEQLSAHFGGPALLLGAYLFFYSWLLLFYYFRMFGISLVSLDIPVYFYLTFAWTAVEYFGVGVLLALTLGAICYVWLNGAWAMDRKPWVHFLHRSAFAVFLMVGLWSTSFLAQQQGELQAQQVRDGGVLAPIRLVFGKDQAGMFPEVLTTAKVTPDQGVKEAVLLVETTAAYYVLVQKVLRDQQTSVTQYDAMGVVYRVPKKYVTYAQMDVINTQRVERLFPKLPSWKTLFN